MAAKEVLFNTMSPKKFYTVKQVADLVGVHRATIRRWLEAGRIPEPDRDRNGWRIFSKEEVEVVLKYANKTIPSAQSQQGFLSFNKSNT